MIMAKLVIDEKFRHYLLSSYPVDAGLLDRLVEDLGEYFSQSVQEYILSRHRELHSSGIRNNEIYVQIQSELKEKRFIGPDLSVRQIRRVIYG